MLLEEFTAYQFGKSSIQFGLKFVQSADRVGANRQNTSTNVVELRVMLDQEYISYTVVPLQ